MMRKGLLGVLVVALVAAACSRTAPVTASTSGASSHATPAEQAAALAATAGYRQLLDDAGQQLAAALGANPPDPVAARAAIDELRAQVAPGSVEDPRLAGALVLGASDQAIEALTPEAPLLSVAVSRVTLSPQDVALALQRRSEWIAAEAELASSPVASEELALTATQLAKGLSMLLPLGELVAPAQAKSAQEACAALQGVVSNPGTSTRSQVGAADLATARLGQLAAALAGHGQGGQYQ